MATIAQLAADLRKTQHTAMEEVTADVLRKMSRQARALVNCKPTTAEEVSLQIEAVIGYCGLELSEDQSDVLVRETMRNAVRFIEAA